MHDIKMAGHVSDMDEWLDKHMEDPLLQEYVEHCPACGQPADYCQGHGEIGDVFGAEILRLHDEDNHEACHSMADCKIEDGAP